MSKRFLGMRPLYIVTLLYTFFPIVSVGLAMVIADALGCTLDEGNAHPCECLGVDIGETLCAMCVMGSLAMMITLPTGFLALLILSIVPETKSSTRRGGGKSQPVKNDPNDAG